MTRPALSVIIPAHNPEPGRLERVLRALHRQTVPVTEWELIVVDNGSSPPIPAGLAGLGHSAGILVTEPRLGLTHARAAGLRRARAPLLVLVDDDNLLEPDYLRHARDLAAAQPAAGAWGGRIIPEFAVPPPAWAGPHLGSLALRDHGAQPLVSLPLRTPGWEYPYFAPLGAGMVLRDGAARKYLDFLDSDQDCLHDRRGSSLGSGGDCELVMQGVLLPGSAVAYSPDLVLRHVIPARRLRLLYLCRLNYAGGVSWQRFLRRYGFGRHSSRWLLPLRAARAALRLRAWTRSGLVAFFSSLGQSVGECSG